MTKVRLRRHSTEWDTVPGWMLELKGAIRKWEMR